MKVENHEGLGNPYHNDSNGQFASANEAGASGGAEGEVEIDTSDIESLLSVGSVPDLGEDDDILSLFVDEGSTEDILEDVDDSSLASMFNAMSRDIEVSEDVQNIPEEELKKTFTESTVLIYGLDKRMIEEASIEELRTLQQALINLDKSNNNKELIELSNQKFEGLWSYPVTPEDYEKYNDEGRLAKKIDYFQNEYNKSDKEEKLAKLNEFIEAGKKYEELSRAINKEVISSKLLVESYKDEEGLYSQKRKDNAVWIKGGQSETHTYFKQRGDQLWNYLKANFPTGANYLYDYTGSYSSLNNPLRGIDYEYAQMNPEKKGGFIDRVEKMTEALDKCTNGFDCWVQRGTNKIFVNDFTLNEDVSKAKLQSLVGTVYRDQGFMSCGTAKQTGFTSSDITMNIYCPKGIKMLYIASHSHYTSENETIINRGYNYKITKAEKIGSKIYLDVECILGSDEGRYGHDDLVKLKDKHF